MTVQDAARVLKETNCYGTMDIAKNVILKALDEHPRWIPLSERLPKDKTYVLTTIKVSNRIAHARSGWYESGFFYNDNGDIWKATDMEVIAWMPLPKPYKAESEDKE
jgi:hypothetical protein